VRDILSRSNPPEAGKPPKGEMRSDAADAARGLSIVPAKGG